MIFKIIPTMGSTIGKLEGIGGFTSGLCQFYDLWWSKTNPRVCMDGITRLFDMATVIRDYYLDRSIKNLELIYFVYLARVSVSGQSVMWLKLGKYYKLYHKIKALWKYWSMETKTIFIFIPRNCSQTYDPKNLRKS